MGFFIELEISKPEDAVWMFRWALTLIGLGIGLVGVSLFFYRPRDESKQSPLVARVVALVCFGLIGLGTIVYTWTGFGS
ncbi:MAG: hypothetical protein VX438_18145 [Planctomycetota bacterium]|nr:hypothetical protein [Planctomycetota bacterium]